MSKQSCEHVFMGLTDEASRCVGCGMTLKIYVLERAQHNVEERWRETLTTLAEEGEK